MSYCNVLKMISNIFPSSRYSISQRVTGTDKETKFINGKLCIKHHISFLAHRCATFLKLTGPFHCKLELCNLWAKWPLYEKFCLELFSMIYYRETVAWRWLYKPKWPHLRA